MDIIHASYSNAFGAPTHFKKDPFPRDPYRFRKGVIGGPYPLLELLVNLLHPCPFILEIPRESYAIKGL